MLIEKINEAGITLNSYHQGSQKVLCPRCSHTRKKKKDPCLSIAIESDHAIWNCHNPGCDFSGRVNANNNTAQMPPIKKSKPPVAIKYNSDKTLPKGLITYFQSRGIGEDTLKFNKIGYGDYYIPAQSKKVNCIWFPYFRDGKIVNIKYRDNSKNFVQEKGAEKIYYGLDDIKGLDSVIIVEGEMDKLSLNEAGYNNVVSVPDGAPSLGKDGQFNKGSNKKFEYIENCFEEFSDKQILIAVDMDAPGRALANELARRYGKERCWLAKWPHKDANETLVKDGIEAVRECIESAVGYPIKGLKAVSDVIEHSITLYNKGSEPGASTGWPSLDQYMRIFPGELSVVTGIPGSGKSEFVDAMMVNMAALHNWRFAVCSFENPPDIHLGKLCEKHLQKPFDTGGHNRMTLQEFKGSAENWAANHFTFIASDFSEETMNIDKILELARAAVLRYGINGLVIDPYNEIEHAIPAGMTETNYISQLLTKVRKFARNHSVHVWFIAHPAKLQKDREGIISEPSLYDIAGSANWVNKADLGVVVHRPNAGNKIDDVTRISVKKVRFKRNGERGEVEFRYNRATGIYSAA